MVSRHEYVELNCWFDYKRLKLIDKEWLASPLLYCSINNTVWCLQINRFHPDKVGVYLTLVSGAPCTLSSYTLSMAASRRPNLQIFINKCTEKRIFASNHHSWGFEHFCTRRELKRERNFLCRRRRFMLISSRKSNFINVRCTMNIEIPILNHVDDDHRLATDLFHTRTLKEWIEFLKFNDDLHELTNRVNEEIEKQLLQ